MQAPKETALSMARYYSLAACSMHWVELPEIMKEIEEVQRRRLERFNFMADREALLNSESARNLPKQDVLEGEWPELGVSNHVDKQQASTFDGSIPARTTEDQSPAHVTTNYDSAKENQETAKPNTPPKSKRKGKKGSKQRWVPLKVELPEDNKPKQSRDFRPFKPRDNQERLKNQKNETKNFNWGDQRNEVTEDSGFPEYDSDRYEQFIDHYYTPSGPPNRYVMEPTLPPEASFYTNSCTPPTSIQLAVTRQMEYYMCVENLQRDFYLRRRMDWAGFVPLSVLAQFNKIKELTQDFGEILKAVKASRVLEVVEDPEKGILVRTRFNPESWPLHDELSDHYLGVPKRNSDAPALDSGVQEYGSWEENPQITKSNPGMMGNTEENPKSNEDNLDFKFDKELDAFCCQMKTKTSLTSCPSFMIPKFPINESIEFKPEDMGCHNPGLYHGPLSTSSSEMYMSRVDGHKPICGNADFPTNGA